jgi:hypothetical protein
MRSDHNRGADPLQPEADGMIIKRNIFLRIFALVSVSIAALTIGVTAFTYSGAANRETVRTLARSFFVQLWKGSQARATEKNSRPSTTPEGRIIQ